MAYSAPITRATGFLVTAARWNQDIVDNQNAAFPLGVGAWTSWTPAVTQLTSVTTTNTRSAYIRLGRTIIANFGLAVTGSGTVANSVTVSLPVTAASILGAVVFGGAWIYDASTVTRYTGVWVPTTTTTVIMFSDVTAASAWGTTPSIALASGDFLSGMLIYEAAT